MPIMRNEEFFGKPKKMSRAESKRKRFLVYDYIKANPDKKITNKDLAMAAGYRCDLCSNDREYMRGMGFIDNMIRSKYISYTDYPGQEGRLWYISGKDKDYDSSLRVTTEATLLPALESENDSGLVAKPIEEDALIVKEEDFHFDCWVSLQVDSEHRVKFNLQQTDLESLLAKIKSAVEVIQ